MKDYRMLSFLDLFRGFFNRMKIDYPTMRKILQVKLLLDSRRVSTIQVNNDNIKQNEDKNYFIRSLPVYTFIGLFFIFFILISDNYIFSMSFVFGAFMVMMMASLISDFSSVLLDVRDKVIVLTKPVDNRTLNMAKVLHVFYYIFMITMAMMLPSLITSLIVRGIGFFLIFLFLVIVVDLFIIMFTALVYIVILKVFSGEKLKDIINYVQIGLSFFIMISYQLIGRVFEFSEVFDISFKPTWWSYLLPPIWFSSTFELLFKNNRESYVLIYSALALLVPIASIIIYIKLIPTFERNLQKLNEADSKGKKKNKINNIIGKIICSNKEERSFYNFATNIIKNERNFKLKVYPSLGFSLIFPFIMIITSIMDNGIKGVANSKLYFSIYFTGLMLTTIIHMLRFSDNYKGAWIYNFFSVNHANVYRGTLKAMFINLVTPIFILISIIFLYLFKGRIISDLIIGYLSLLLTIYVLHKIGDKVLPFSETYGTTKSGNILEFIKLLLVFGVLIGLHFGTTFIPFGKYFYILILIVLNKVAWKYGFKEKKVGSYSQENVSLN
ncbi:hypothetical protein GOQ27_11315 [Clostridium sp. D2Q-11]|uniref:Uncharacterized protein n=1 Tax=Anaeromonas frigoriresistens TaxID=2683708 RepID=A0A942UTP7_9FIRM|nr:hypothetical protein [Anaeromonas frigoriresistens]MBS4539054.1 hypothetical protein [Anaeromonas frigoriresistens]